MIESVLCVSLLVAGGLLVLLGVLAGGYFSEGVINDLRDRTEWLDQIAAMNYAHAERRERMILDAEAQAEIEDIMDDEDEEDLDDPGCAACADQEYFVIELQNLLPECDCEPGHCKAESNGQT